MGRCPSCSAELPAASRFCLKCGAGVSVTDSAEMETVAIETAVMARSVATPRPNSHPASHTGNSGIPAYRFEPGTLLASRYRIISRLGKGGMGEVFRADDIMLGQPVALKFLSENATGHLSLLTRFYDEVCIARQITHTNVCRVYDIGEVEGQPYLSMEYMDELAEVPRSDSRFPQMRAASMALSRRTTRLSLEPLFSWSRTIWNRKCGWLMHWWLTRTRTANTGSMGWRRGITEC